MNHIAVSDYDSTLPSASTGWPMRSLTPLIDDVIPIDLITEQLHNICGNFIIVPKEGQHNVRGGTRLAKICGQEAVIISQNSNHIMRDAQCIRRDPGENFFLIFQDHGQSVMCQDNLQFRMHPGDVALIDSTRPSDFIYAGAHSQQISVHLPRDEMQQRFGAALHSTPCLLQQDALGLAMRAILGKLLEPANQESNHLKEAFMAVLGSYLLERSNMRQPTRYTNNETLLSTSLQQISLRFSDPTFNAASLAATLNIPLRSLQRLFQRLDETPSRRILNTRLHAAYERLSLQTGTVHSHYISSIAYHCGFNDLSFFYREFRKKYGTTPGHLIHT